VSTEVEGEGGQ